MLTAPPHAGCGYYSITGNPVLDTALYVLLAVVLLAVIAGAIVWVIGAYQAGRGR